MKVEEGKENIFCQTRLHRRACAMLCRVNSCHRLLVILALCLCVSIGQGAESSAEPVVTAQSEMRINYQPVGRYIPVESSQRRNRLWDMSENPVAGDEIQTRVEIWSDSLKSITFPGIRYDCHIVGDTLRLVRTETHYAVNVSKEGGIVFMHGLQPGESVSSETSSRGRHWQWDESAGVNGTRYGVVSTGSLVLPGDEIYQDVTLSRIDTETRMLPLEHVSSGVENVSDSLLWNVAPVKQTTYVWTSPGMDMPLAMTFIPFEDEEQAVTWIYSGEDEGESGKQPRAGHRQRPPVGTPYDETPDNTADSGMLRVSADGRMLTVDLSDMRGTCQSDTAESVSGVMSDALGRVVFTASGTDIISGDRLCFPLDGLPGGEYLISVIIGDNRLTVKYIHR